VAHTLQVSDETHGEADKPTKTHGEKKEVVVRNTGGQRGPAAVLSIVDAGLTL